MSVIMGKKTNVIANCIIFIILKKAYKLCFTTKIVISYPLMLTREVAVGGISITKEITNANSGQIIKS